MAPYYFCGGKLWKLVCSSGYEHLCSNIVLVIHGPQLKVYSGEQVGELTQVLFIAHRY